jgi:hypothetical protein
MEDSLTERFTPESFMSISEASIALGLHANTIRQRIKAGKYRTEWIKSSHGPQQLIRRDEVLANGVEDQTPPVKDVTISFIEQPRGHDARELLEPVFEKLAATMVENGRLQERVAMLESQLTAIAASSVTQGSIPTSQKRSWTDRCLAFMRQSNDR